MNMGSSLGSIGYPGYSVYCASKFAMRGFSEALGRELEGSGIKVLRFAPAPPAPSSIPRPPMR